jgi:hypothetical protein
MVKKKRTSQATKLGVKLAELGVAAPLVVAHRLARMAAAGPKLSTRDRREFTGMVAEKQAAFTQAYLNLCTSTLSAQQQLAAPEFLRASPSQKAAKLQDAAAKIASAGLSPVHRKAVANAKRLARTKLR